MTTTPPGSTYRVTASHRTDYPDPITLSADDMVVVGERYAGPEGWDEWYWCTSAAGQAGWVPGQILERGVSGQARAREAYTAQELDVDPGQALIASRHLNGWCWCTRTSDGTAGWVPLSALQADAAA